MAQEERLTVLEDYSIFVANIESGISLNEFRHKIWRLEHLYSEFAILSSLEIESRVLRDRPYFYQYYRQYFQNIERIRFDASTFIKHSRYEPILITTQKANSVEILLTGIQTFSAVVMLGYFLKNQFYNNEKNRKLKSDVRKYVEEYLEFYLGLDRGYLSKKERKKIMNKLIYQLFKLRNENIEFTHMEHLIQVPKKPFVGDPHEIIYPNPRTSVETLKEARRIVLQQLEQRKLWNG